jgi:hypothetical protein
MASFSPQAQARSAPVDTGVSRPAGSAAELNRAEHSVWLETLARWRHDIDRWQEQHRSAIDRLIRLQRGIEDHGCCLADHAIIIDGIEAATRAHDARLADTATTDPDLKADHIQQQADLVHTGEIHRQIAEHHAAVMAAIQAVEAALAAPLKCHLSTSASGDRHHE